MPNKKKSIAQIACTHAFLEVLCLISRIEAPYVAVCNALDKNDTLYGGELNSGTVSSWTTSKKTMAPTKAQQIINGVLEEFGWEKAQRLCIIYNEFQTKEKNKVSIPSTKGKLKHSNRNIVKFDLNLIPTPTEDEELNILKNLLIEKALKFNAGENDESTSSLRDWYYQSTESQRINYTFSDSVNETIILVKVE